MFHLLQATLEHCISGKWRISFDPTRRDEKNEVQLDMFLFLHSSFEMSRIGNFPKFSYGPILHSKGMNNSHSYRKWISPFVLWNPSNPN